MHSYQGSMARVTFAAACLATSPAQGASAGESGQARKSGLWEISTTIQGQPKPSSILQCVDERTDDVMGRGGIKDAKCSRNEVKLQGNRITVSSACEIGGTRMTTEGVFTGSFDSAYRAELKTPYDPPMMGMKQATMVIDAKWTGPCKAGQKPGQIVAPHPTKR